MLDTMSIRTFPPLAKRDLQHVVGLVAEPLWESLRCKRIFLTGGTGFVGKWLLESLAEADRNFGLECEVVVLSRDRQAFERSVPHLAKTRGVQLVQGDVRNFTDVDGRFDCVIHAATDVVTQRSPMQIYDTCVLGTRRVLEFAAKTGCRDFLLISSGAIYGQQPNELTKMPETYKGAPDLSQPQTAYGQSKRVAEWLASALATEYGLRVVTARLFSFVGPYLALDKQFAIGNFMRDAIADMPIIIKGDGTSVRSYLYSADMAGWLWNILFRGQAGKAYNVGSGQCVTMSELAHIVARATSSSRGIRVLGKPAIGVLPERYVPDVTRANNELSLRSVISLEESIKRTVEWYRTNNNVL